MRIDYLEDFTWGIDGMKKLRDLTGMQTAPIFCAASVMAAHLRRVLGQAGNPVARHKFKCKHRLRQPITQRF